MEEREGRSLAETPTWTVASVITFMVVFGFFFNGSLERFGKVHITISSFFNLIFKSSLFDIVLVFIIFPLILCIFFW